MKTEVRELYAYGECKYVVVFAATDEGLLLCRKRGRDCWETPGGHIEPGESATEAARRELWEETGVREAEIVPAFDYRAEDEEGGANGRVFWAGNCRMSAPPEEFEMEEVRAFQKAPEKLSYPGIFPVLLREMERRRGTILKETQAV